MGIVRRRMPAASLNQKSKRPAAPGPLMSSDPGAFLRSDMCGYLSGRGWMVWRLTPSIGGMVLWGHQSEEQASEIVRVCSEGLGALSSLDPAVPFTALLDLRHAGSIDLSAFAVFHAWLIDVNKQHSGLRVVLLCEPSPESATLLGLVQMSAPRIVLAAGVEALGPILEDAGAPKALMARIDCTIEKLMEPSPIASLRDTLSRGQAMLSLTTAARKLGMSVRSLQRALEREGTTFERERAQVRKGIFEALVSDQSVKIDAVAASLGFGSVRAFSTAFRRAVGVSPRAFRHRTG